MRRRLAVCGHQMQHRDELIQQHPELPLQEGGLPELCRCGSPSKSANNLKCLCSMVQPAPQKSPGHIAFPYTIKCICVYMHCRMFLFSLTFYCTICAHITDMAITDKKIDIFLMRSFSNLNIYTEVY